MGCLDDPWGYCSHPRLVERRGQCSKLAKRATGRPRIPAPATDMWLWMQVLLDRFVPLLDDLHDQHEYTGMTGWVSPAVGQISVEKKGITWQDSIMFAFDFVVEFALEAEHQLMAAVNHQPITAAGAWL